MKVLVTGGLGLIGHNVVALLQSQRHEVTVVDSATNYGVIPTSELDYLLRERRQKILASTPCYRVSVDDLSSFDLVVRRHRPDVIIHMAAHPRQKVVGLDPSRASTSMMTGLINVCESARAYKVNRVVYISSSMVYGDFTDQVREDAPCHPQGQYGIMKLAGEWLIRDYTRRGSFDHVIIRPSAVYGPLDVEDRVIAKFLITAMHGGEITVNGATETLDFTYVQDAAQGIVSAATVPAAANNTYNITKSHSWTLLDAARLAVDIAGGGTINVRDRDQDFPSRGALNIDAARRDLGFDPKVDIDQGFRIYHDWLKDSIYWSTKTV